MLTLTEGAQRTIGDILDSPALPDTAGLRIEPSGKTTTEAADLRAGIAAEPDPADQIVEESGARVFVDADVVDLLDAKVLDVTPEGDRLRFALLDRP